MTMRKKINVVSNQISDNELIRTEIEILNHFISGLEEYTMTYGFMSEYSLDENSIYFDDLEWISIDNIKRIEELGIDIDLEFPNGFHLYNENGEIKEYRVDDSVLIYTLDETNVQQYTEQNHFKEKMETISPFCKVVMHEEEVVVIIETYIP